MILEQAFADICRGYSIFTINNTDYYVKHSNFIEQSIIDKKIQYEINQAVELGLKKESDIIQDLIKSNKWPASHEKKLSSYLDDIKNLDSTKRNIKDRMEINPLYDAIEELKSDYSALYNKRAALIKNPAESLGFINSHQFIISQSVYTSKELSERMFSEKSLEGMNDDEFEEVAFNVINITNGISYEIIKKICIEPFFYGIYGISENPFFIFGIPFVQLTINQGNLLKLARTYSKVISEMDDVPDEFLDNPEKILMWYYLKQNGGVVTKEEIKEEENAIRKLLRPK